MQKALKQKKCTPFVLTLTKNKERYTAQRLLHLTQCVNFVIISTMRRAARARQKKLSNMLPKKLQDLQQKISSGI